ncbi:unnamed protein product [Cylicocyclus nassatus]|uniref:Large ribosomal subunit protein uL10 n=1 Tax=Cylicocyclus nassatus TaxID=53992 RepID=A0AA36GLZ7_CYLNA|nr:unnamed protein product [Cylicocyclus nassatus]
MVREDRTTWKANYFLKLIELYEYPNCFLVGVEYVGSKQMQEIRQALRGCSAKAGAIAPCDVKLPPQITGMGPEKTSFFRSPDPHQNHQRDH